MGVGPHGQSAYLMAQPEHLLDLMGNERDFGTMTGGSGQTCCIVYLISSRSYFHFAYMAWTFDGSMIHTILNYDNYP